MALRRIGGASSRTSFFGSGIDRTQVKPILITLALTAAAYIFFGIAAVALGVVAIGVVFFFTSPSRNGSVVERRAMEQRFKERISSGWIRFIPFEQTLWDQTRAAYKNATSSVVKEQLGLVLAAMRSMPDGAAGMGWLVSAPNQPGVAWHSPAGEESYLSVAFTVRGMFSGAVPSWTQENAQEGFSKLLLEQAGPEVLCSGIQIVTRVSVPEQALAAAWVDDHLSPTAHSVAVQSLADVMARTHAGAWVQQHVVVARFPITQRFREAASKFGEGREGWRALMSRQVPALQAALTGAGFEGARAMTARAVASMIKHQQDPDHAPGAVRDVNPMSFGVASVDKWNAHIVLGSKQRWYHRTCRVTAADMSLRKRSPFWLLPLLRSSRSGPVTIATSHDVVPAASALSATNKDVTRTRSEANTRAKKGLIRDPNQDESLKAANEQRTDLTTGQQAGDNWVIYITVSARSFDELSTACENLEFVGANKCGINSVRWMDTYQSSASGCTWPIFRGMAPVRVGAIDRLKTFAQGNAMKNVIVTDQQIAPTELPATEDHPVSGRGSRRKAGRKKEDARV